MVTSVEHTKIKFHNTFNLNKSRSVRCSSLEYVETNKTNLRLILRGRNQHTMDSASYCTYLVKESIY